MAKIEDYALIGNRETAALVCKNGSVDWLCMPRFDSGAFFSAILGNEQHGHWLIAPEEDFVTTRHYIDGTLVLKTTHNTSSGSVTVTDFMTREEDRSYLMRRVSGDEGVVKMVMSLVVRPDYGSTIPWASRLDDGRIQYVSGPERLVLQTPVGLENEDMESIAYFEIKAGKTYDFVLGWSHSYQALPPPVALENTLRQTVEHWQLWAGRFNGIGKYSDAVERSLLTLRALGHFETGGIVAAPTTSLPEALGGERNWDYRFCWLRDASLTLFALMQSNYQEEAELWRHWLVRAIAGSPAQLQIMYGVAGEKWLDERELPWLPGYENSGPVRIGNAASGQIQLDIYGEVMEALYIARKKGLPEDAEVWAIQLEMLKHLAEIWNQPDDGIWEVRGGRQHFVHSKIMAWLAFDSAIRSVRDFGLQGPVEDWKAIRDHIHAEVCLKGFDPKRNSFVQYYGANGVDAALLLIPMVGFLPADDPRVAGTVKAIEDELLQDGLVLRYRTENGVDGLARGEGAFLACSFWLASNYALLNRMDEAHNLFEYLLTLSNDVGLLAEEYDPHAKRQVGNFPQAFSHIALINTAYNLAQVQAPAAERATVEAAHG
ncbi:MAG: glycoside hydrolase family 15 protein [Rhodospirillales bacterium]|nr:glycoside hydrolase family 15 protein [Rhodospirillales bacterium]